MASMSISKLYGVQCTEVALTSQKVPNENLQVDLGFRALRLPKLKLETLTLTPKSEGLYGSHSQ